MERSDTIGEFVSRVGVLSERGIISALNGVPTADVMSFGEVPELAVFYIPKNLVMKVKELIDEEMGYGPEKKNLGVLGGDEGGE